VVRAVLGHFFFVYIHPYMDGNERIGRFLIVSTRRCPGCRLPVDSLDTYAAVTYRPQA